MFYPLSLFSLIRVVVAVTAKDGQGSRVGQRFLFHFLQPPFLDRLALTFETIETQVPSNSPAFHSSRGTGH